MLSGCQSSIPIEFTECDEFAKEISEKYETVLSVTFSYGSGSKEMRSDVIMPGNSPQEACAVLLEYQKFFQDEEILRKLWEEVLAPGSPKLQNIHEASAFFTVYFYTASAQMDMPPNFIFWSHNIFADQNNPDAYEGSEPWGGEMREWSGDIPISLSWEQIQRYAQEYKSQ